mgnify:CR=1 FL=1
MPFLVYDSQAKLLEKFEAKSKYSRKIHQACQTLIVHFMNMTVLFTWGIAENF